MSEEKSLTLHRIQQYFITGLMCFSTFMLADMYRDWKQHLRDDKEVEIKVEKHDEAIPQLSQKLNILSGRVETISDRINKGKDY